MKTYARIVGGHIVDVTTGDPATMFHPSLAAQFIIVPDGALNGATLVNGVCTNPLPTTAPIILAVPPSVSPPELLLLFSSAERVAIRAACSTDPAVEDFLLLLNDARLPSIDLSLLSIQTSIEHALNAAHSPDVPERLAEILTGVPK